MPEQRSVLACQHVIAGKGARIIDNDYGNLGACCGCGAVFGESIRFHNTGIMGLSHMSDEGSARSHLTNLAANCRAGIGQNGCWDFKPIENEKADEIPAGAKWMLGNADFVSQFSDSKLFALQKTNGEVAKIYFQSGYEMVAFWTDITELTRFQQTSPVAVKVTELTLEILDEIDQRFGCFLVNPDADDYQRVVSRHQIARRLS